MIEGRKECVGRMGKNTKYCVCNTTYCDDMDPIVKQPKGEVLLYQTSQAGDRFKEYKRKFVQTSGNPSLINLTIDKSKKFQKILGIGAAFTDSAGININTLPKPMAEGVIKDYFSPNGIEFNMARIPIASCDFSDRYYTYDDVKDDFELKHWNLTHDDFQYKVCN